VYNGNSSGGPLEDRNVIDTGLTSGTININYDFFQLEDTMHIYYQGVRIYDSGLTNGANSISVNFGPGLSTVVTIVVNEGGSPQPTTAWVYSASIVQEHLIYTTFTDSTNLTTLPIKFATPPFTNSVGMVQTNAVLFDDGFEHATPGAYNVGSYVSGWRVIYGTAIVHGTNNTLGVQPNSGTNFVELVGSPGNPAAVGTNTLLRPDYPFRLTFAYHRNPRTPAGQTNVVAVYTNGVLAQFVYIQPGPWQTATYDFEVNSGAIDLQIRSATPTGALIDSVEISEHADFENRFFLPEEPLKPLMGETALGEWTLELEDNRVGPTSGFPRRLLSWELELTFANTNFPATLLTNCTPQTNVVSVYEPNSCNPLTNSVVLGQIKYFIVDVPRSATMATNLLSGSGDLKLLYSSLGLPTGAFPGDWVQDGPGNTETLILDTNPAPILQLQPGQRYYLGVANVNTNTSNSFVISVAFNSIDTNLLNVIALTNAIPFTRTIPVTNAIDYYQFTVASNATEATFDLLPVNGNVDLVVRKALPVPDPLPRPNPGEFDYISLSTGTNADIIVISQAVQGVPLQPGLYYVGVFNVDTVPVTYSITATARTNVSGLNIIPLTNAVPLNFTIGAGAAMTNFFSFDVTQTNSAVLFELYNLNDIADLLLDYNTYPSPTSWFAAQLGSNGAPAQIVIRTNASVPVVNGRWYLAVDNLQNTNLSFAIRAAVSSTNGMLTSGLPLTVVFTAGTPPYTSVDLEWNSVVGEKYSVETSTDLVTWTPVPGMPITATDIFTTYSDPIVPGQPALFYRVRQVP
jgi:subtilisin-like proprotein convertase family protein